MLLGLFLIAYKLVSAQEIDTGGELATPVQELPSGIPESSLSYKADFSVYNRDQLRLDIIAMQIDSFQTSGDYIQVKDAQALSGDSITFEAVVGSQVDSNQEIHVYEAPCGKGWQLLITDYAEGYIMASSGQAVLGKYPVYRSYGYGCEHIDRTYNW